MQIVLIILSAGLLGLIVKFAVSPKSSRPLKLTALAALVLIVLSIGICGALIVMGPEENPEEFGFPVLEESAPPPEKENNVFAIITFLLVFLVILGIIFIIARREQRNTGKAVSAPGTSVFSRRPPPESRATDRKLPPGPPGKEDSGVN